MKKREKEFSHQVASIVLAGGQGTRLYPLTAGRCKPAVPFGGHYRLIDIPISNSLNSKIYQIFIVSQYFAGPLHDHIISTYQLDHFKQGGLSLLTPQETGQGKTWFKGTADAVRQNLTHVCDCPAEYFIILSGDQLYNMDLMDMVVFAQKTNADLVVAALPVEEAEARRMGLLKCDGEGAITDFIEKPNKKEELADYALQDKKDTWLGSMGIYVFKREALIKIMREEGDDFGHHLIPAYIHQGRSFAYVYQGYWEDIGTVASYYRANLMMTQKNAGLDTYNDIYPIFSHPKPLPSALIRGTHVKESIISQGCVIEAAEIHQSVIGVRTTIGEGTSITGTIVMGNRAYMPRQNPSSAHTFTIGKHCTIRKAIIDEDVHIGNHVQLINQKNVSHLDGDKIFIRDGIIIVPGGTHLPDGFIL